MRKSAFKLALALLLLALLAAGALHAVLGSGSPFHLDKSDCAGCHLGGRNVTVQQAGMLTASQETLCAKCHPAATQVSHPSGLQPAAKPPAAYPLDWKGDLTCSTCHDVHGSGPGLMRGTLAGKGLCLACHAADFFSKMRDGGASLAGAHLAKGIAPGGPALDAYSRKCMECHGENASPRLATSIDKRGVVRHASQSANHPIGMLYQKSVAFGGYRPLRMLSSKLLLPDGKVSCVSCHAGYQKEHGKLLLAMAKSALCFECHAL